MNNGMHGIIFSYEKGSHLGALIENRIHGSVPFGGDYRMVDFMLSNMVNAGISDVGIIMHGKCQSLLDHLGTGKSWDLSRKFGGLKLLPAFAYQEGRGAAQPFLGKVEALGCVMEYLRHIRQEYVVLSDSDFVANLPLQDVLAEHIASGAELTAVCADSRGRGADTYFTVDDSGRITDVACDVYTPVGYQCLNVFLLRTDKLIEVVEQCMAHNCYSFHRDVLHGKALTMHGYVWSGYGHRISTVRDYFDYSMELLDPAIRGVLFCPDRPIYAKDNDAASSYVDPDGVCVNSLISDGCDIQGSVRNSILSRGVRVEKGAKVEDCILFKDTVVHTGAQLHCVIADKNVEFGPDIQMTGERSYPVVVAKNSVI